MPKKTISCTQVRLDPELINSVESLRDKWQVKVSRSAFVNFLIRQGIRHHENIPESDTGESSFKK